MRATQRIERYCRTCQSVIPGFDHHCTFLNICVGTRTYFFFYTLALTGTLLFTWQCVFCALIAAGVWRDPDTESDVGLTILAGLASLFAFSGVLSFGALCTFHTYLLTQGIGTYDWMLRRTEIIAATEEREHSRQQQQQQVMATATTNRETALAEVGESSTGHMGTPAGIGSGGGGAAAADVSLVEIMPMSDANSTRRGRAGAGAEAMTREEEVIPFSSSVNANEVVAPAAIESSTSSATATEITVPSL